ncbi:HVO_0234 family beta-propeller protein [Haloplanus halobius]|uniref:HVO_0234 family beta-propeller protein n=1 Tax=Haloplanus halobius TaxID=2934938 RepID=UPI00200F6A06|nr:hypothetical protein [Haloplanus sp. XH21]
MAHDLTIDEKRVYADRMGAVEVLVAAEQGVVVASLSDDRVGEFSLDHRTTARDVVADGTRRAVATDEDVLVGDYSATGFGAAVAVGFDGPGGDLLAAGPDGRVARLDDGWTTVGHVDDPRAIDAGMVAAADGVWTVDDGLRNVGLADVRDVHGRGLPLAATGDGLYRLGNGWMDELDGAADVVSADDADDRAHAVSDGTLFARDAVASWTPVDLPADAPPVDVGYTDAATVAVTEGGTLLTDAGDGWRTRELGVTGVTGLAVQS